MVFQTQRQLIALVFAGLVALTALPITVVVSSKFPLGTAAPFVYAAAFSFLIGAMFSAFWPKGSWRWGIVSSAGYWLFFGYTFVALLRNGEIDWVPLIAAGAMIAVGCLGAQSGNLYRQSRASTPPTEQTQC